MELEPNQILALALAVVMILQGLAAYALDKRHRG